MACRGSIYAWHRAIVGTAATAVAAIHEISFFGPLLSSHLCFGTINEPKDTQTGATRLASVLQAASTIRFHASIKPIATNRRAPRTSRRGSQSAPALGPQSSRFRGELVVEWSQSNRLPQSLRTASHDAPRNQSYKR